MPVAVYVYISYMLVLVELVMYTGVSLFNIILYNIIDKLYKHNKMASRTSRKKSKGKDRKAKKEADKVEAERLRARTIWLKWAKGDLVGKTIACKHVSGNEIETSTSNNHPVCLLMDTVFCGTRSMSDVIDLHPQVWNNECYRKMAVCILIRVGTNMLLSENDAGFHLARVIVVIELYDGNPSSVTAINSRETQSKMRDLSIGSASIRRDALKFYSKRVQCSCLKSMHQTARETIPKIGICMGCGKEKERVALSVCSRCMITQYCSRECQVANWPEHNEKCDDYVNAHEQQTQAVDEMPKQKDEQRILLRKLEG